MTQASSGAVNAFVQVLLIVFVEFTVLLPFCICLGLREQEGNAAVCQGLAANGRKGMSGQDEQNICT